MKKNTLAGKDYEALKLFVVHFADWYIPADKKSQKPEHQPLVFLKNLEQKSMSNAKKGVQMAIDDFVEMTSEWSAERVIAADAKFAASGIVTLTEIRRNYSKTFARILKRGVVRTETEYYLLRGVLDGSALEVGSERQQLEGLLAAYEAKLMKKLPSLDQKEDVAPYCSTPT